MDRCFSVFKLCVIAFAIMLTGCATTSINSPSFVDIQPPTSGFARLYIFRPGFSQLSRGESPTLLINEKEVGRLSNESYVSLMYRPGAYKISLRPNFLESSVWDASTQISLEPDKTYFLAIWNNTESTKGIGFVPVLGKNPILLALPADSARNTNIRFEFVQEHDAVPVLNGMSLISSKQEF